MRHQSPGTTRPHQPAQRVKHLPQAVCPLRRLLFHQRQIGRTKLPLFITHVTRIWIRLFRHPKRIAGMYSLCTSFSPEKLMTGSRQIYFIVIVFGGTVTRNVNFAFFPFPCMAVRSRGYIRHIPLRRCRKPNEEPPQPMLKNTGFGKGVLQAREAVYIACQVCHPFEPHGEISKRFPWAKAIWPTRVHNREDG